MPLALSPGERREALEYAIGPKGKYSILNSRKSLRAMEAVISANWGQLQKKSIFTQKMV